MESNVRSMPSREHETPVLEELLAQLQVRHPARVVRDLGMHSKTVGEAIDIIKEAAPTLGLYLDRLGYRTIGQGVRDLTESARQTILRRVEWLVTTNPIAQRAMQIRTDLVVSEGFNIVSTSKTAKDEVQRVLDRHWEVNEWEDRIWDRVHDLGVTGEMIRCKPDTSIQLSNGELFHTGVMECGMILPHYVNSIQVDKWNAERLTQIILSASGGYDPVPVPIVRKEKLGLQAGQYIGSAFYTGINRRPGATRGLSDLLAVVEWLDVFDQLVFNEAERSAMLLRFLFDIEIQDAKQDEIDERTETLKARPPGRGTCLVHNQREQWKVIQPSIDASQSDVLTNRIFLLAWGGLGLPEHWYSAANTVNKASAQEMDTPVFAWTRGRKAKVVHALTQEHAYAIQIARRAGYFKGIDPADLTFEVQSRDPDRTAYDVVGQALNSLASALAISITAGLMGQKQAAKVFQQTVGALGFDVEQHVPDAPDNLGDSVQQAMQLIQTQRGKLDAMKMGHPGMPETALPNPRLRFSN